MRPGPNGFCESRYQNCAESSVPTHTPGNPLASAAPKFDVNTPLQSGTPVPGPEFTGPPRRTAPPMHSVPPWNGTAAEAKP